VTGGTALDARMSTAIDRIGTVDLCVGIPSYRNARTIGHVARTVADGLRRAFPNAQAVVINADGGSDDGTRDRVTGSLDGTPSIVGEYVGPPGKGSAFRAIFEAVIRSGARACAVVDSDLRSITPEWIERLLGPIVRGEADYVAPLYARHKHDGTITNTIAYPLTRALYGQRIRQPIGGEFAFTADLARAFLEGGALGGFARPSVGDVWASDVARFGIDILMTTTALVRGARVAQAFLGAKVHDPKDPGADLGPMFRQVVGTCFRLAVRNSVSWRNVMGSREVSVIGDVRAVEPEEVRVDAALLVRKLRDGAAQQRATWREVLSPASAEAVERALAEDVPRSLSSERWADVVYDLLAASARRPERTDDHVAALLPLYFGRVAAFVDEVAGMTTADAERVVEAQAAAFESRKPRLVEAWPAA
jgi:glucosylglycerate synthase